MILNNLIENCYKPLFDQYGFTPSQGSQHFNTVGTCWEMDSSLGTGFYWIYAQKDLFDIKIHDFYFHEDTFMEFHLPECMNITEYESISGEELSPYRRLSAGCVKTFIGGSTPFKALIHKKIPIHSIGIEILPAYYNDYLKKQYPGAYSSPLSAFQQIDQTSSFPEMTRLLHQIKTYRGTGIGAHLFYESKVAEAVSLVMAKQEKLNLLPKKHLSSSDLNQLENVTAYLNDHYAFDVPLERLAKIACMGTTKLKTSFKLLHSCTVTEYVQQRRMSQAEHLLTHTDLTIGQVSQTVGYASSSRFAELFRKSTGILPGEYRKIASHS